MWGTTRVLPIFEPPLSVNLEFWKNRWHLINSLAAGRSGANLKTSNIQMHIKARYLEHFLWNCPQVNATRCHWWLIPFFFRKWLGAIRQQAITWANNYQVLWCHMAALGHSKLTLQDILQDLGGLNITWANTDVMSIGITGKKLQRCFNQNTKYTFSKTHFKKIKFQSLYLGAIASTQWGRVMHICVSNLDHHCFRYNNCL